MASTSLQVLSEENIKLLQATEGITNRDILKQHYMQSGNNIFIKKPGLLNKLEQKFGKNGTSVYSEIPSEEEVAQIRKMSGVPAEYPVAVMKGIIEVLKDGKPTGQKYTSYGTATYFNCSNKTVYIEMAETRGILRSARLATNCGWTCVEEVTDSEPTAATITITEQQTEDQKEKYLSLYKNLGIGKSQLQAVIKKALGGKDIESTKNLSKSEMSLIISALQELENARLLRVQDEKNRQAKVEAEKQQQQEREQSQMKQDDIVDGIVLDVQEGEESKEKDQEVNKEQENKEQEGVKSEVADITGSKKDKKNESKK